MYITIKSADQAQGWSAHTGQSLSQRPVQDTMAPGLAQGSLPPVPQHPHQSAYGFSPLVSQLPQDGRIFSVFLFNLGDSFSGPSNYSTILPRLVILPNISMFCALYQNYSTTF